MATAITTAVRVAITQVILVVMAATGVAIDSHAQPAAQPDRPSAALPGSLRAARSGGRLAFTLDVALTSPMNENEIFYPENETWRLMKERFETDGALILKLRRSEALSLDRSMARTQRLNTLATKQGVLNSFQYWVIVVWELLGAFFRYIFAPNAARVREFYLGNGKTIASVNLLPCPDEPKCMLVRLNRTATSNTAVKRDAPQAARPLP